MADVALSVETRSQRSRSKTPGTLIGENGDWEKRAAKKIPTISLIEEEEVLEVVSSSQGPRPKRNRRSAKATTDAASAGEVAVESTVTKTTVKETVIRKSINGSGESSEQTTVTTTQSSSKAAVEAAEAPESQSMFNNILNAIKTSTPIINNKRSQRATQAVSSSGTGINIADHPAYKEYKESGEYWNNTPKTDYTYSELSPHRRVLSNGSVALPNMSRRSLENYNGRVQVMIQSNPTEESFLRRKFLSTNNYSFQKRSADLQYDSADEVDVSDLRRSLHVRRKQDNNIISRFFLMIINSMYNFASSVKRTFTGSNQRYAYTPIRKQHGIIRRSYESFKNFFLLGFSQVYLFVSTVLCIDTWILYTRSENVIENRRRKRFLLLLLILLPLLLLGGACLYLDPPKGLSFPKITLPKLSLPKITLPSLPKLSLPAINWPTLPTLSWPTMLTFSFSWPTLPTLSWPAVLTFTWPAFLTFSWPSFEFSWPSFSWPAYLTFTLPTFSWPNISFEWLSFSRPEWLKFPDLSFNWPTISFEWLSFSRPEWLKFPEFSFPSINWPSISLPSMPTFNISPYTGYAADKFSAAWLSSGEFLFKVRESVVGFLNEAQIVWNENFNSVASSAPQVVVVEPAQ